MKRWLAGASLLFWACSSGPDLPPVPDRDDLKLDLSVESVYGELIEKPLDPTANGHLAMALHRLGQYPEAESLYRRAHLLDPNAFQWLYYMAHVQALEGNYIAAVATMRQALARDASSMPAQLAIGEYSLRAGDLVQSTEAFRQIQGAGPAAAWAAFRLGQLASHQAALGEDVLSHLARACELFPEFGAAQYALARQYERMRQQSESQEHFRIAQQHRLSEPLVEDPLLQAVFGDRYRAVDYVRYGTELIDAEQAAQATAAFERALGFDPTRVEAHVGLIRSYGRVGRTADAQRHFEQARDLDASYDEVYVQYGAVLIEVNRFQEARAMFTHALELNPYSATALAYRGYLDEQNGSYSDAVRSYQASLANDPDFPQVHLRLGAVALREHLVETAAKEFAAALRDPDETSPRMLFQIGLLYEKTGDPATAERYRERARAAAASFNQSGVDWEAEASRWPLG